MWSGSARGTFRRAITEEYKGDFNTIKNNLNTLISATAEITAAAEKVAGGDLTVELRARSEQDKLMFALANMDAGADANGI